MWNANTLHNGLNVLLTLAGAVSAVLLFSGCTAYSVAIVCTESWLPPWTIAPMLSFVAGVGALKLLMNVKRDGVGGLTAPQPAVRKGKK